MRRRIILHETGFPHKTFFTSYFIDGRIFALLSGGWVPVIPRSFHYWQPAPRRLFPWLGNPGNPAMSPHAAGKGTRHTENISGKRDQKGEGHETAYKLSPQVCDTPMLNKAH